jgi:nicotinamide mononucleotide transporter
MKIAAYILSTVCSCLLVVASYKKFLPISLSEAFGFITGALCVWLTVKENIWNWPVGIANDIFFVVVFWESRLFADMTLQFLYIALGFLGWYQWLYGGEQKSPLRISSIGWRLAFALLIATFAVTAALTIYLRSVHDSAPFWDAFTTVLSLVAQYLLTRKILQNWLVWITADFIYIGLYLYKGLALTSLLYLIFLLMCVAGWREWRASLSALPTTNPLLPELSTE